MNKEIIVIGGGIGGMSTALRLRSQGHKVKLFEKNDFLGGKLSESYKDGFRFDMGPSVFTLPELVDELLAEIGSEQSFERERITSPTRYIFSDGSIIEFPLKQLDTGVEKLLKKAKRIYDLVKPVFLESSLQSISTYFKPKTIWAMFNLPFLGLGMTLDTYLRKFIKDPKLIQIFSRYATYNGSSPYMARGIYLLIAHVEMALGVYAPKGGMITLTRLLAKEMDRLGIDICLEEEVLEILHQRKIVTGVRTKKGEYSADIIVSNGHVGFTYGNLLKDEAAFSQELSKQSSNSGVVFYWGVSEKFDSLDIHNTFFGKDYKEEFDHIFNKKNCAEEPSFYINISSRYSRSDAPQGMDAFFVMVNTPWLQEGQNWDLEISRLRTYIIKKLSDYLHCNFESKIVTEEVLDPRVISKRYLSPDGSIYGSSSNKMSSAFFRQGNQSKKYKNLYFVGGSAHPGGGIPLCILSGKIAARLIAKRHK